MPIPKFDQIFLPILQVLSDGKVYKTSDIPEEILKRTFFVLTESERVEKTSTGANLFNDRVAWAKSYLKQGRFLFQPSRGLVAITEKGSTLLKSGVKKFELAELKKDSDFQSYSSKSRPTPSQTKVEELSPQDLIDRGFTEINSALKKELLEKLYTVNPYYFERIILELFKKMGYGEFNETPKSGDGGIDGIMNQDELGLEKISTQAKRYGPHNKVREPEIRNFIGAMSGDISKGIFVTTSSFDESAVKKAQTAHHKIILIDGERLADLLIKYSVGVQITQTYTVKQIDEDFFELG